MFSPELERLVMKYFTFPRLNIVYIMMPGTPPSALRTAYFSAWMNSGLVLKTIEYIVKEIDKRNPTVFLLDNHSILTA